MNTLIELKLTQIKPSKTNPRKRFDDQQMKDLTASVKENGILSPILVRPQNGHYEVVCGSRRFKAAESAGLESVQVIVRELDDKETLELQIMENLQREDVHPMEEADAYFQLSRKPGYDVEKIAGKIGKSEKYVYDRMKLLSLSKKAQELFLKDKFTAGHAILLARLSPSEQAKALDPNTRALFLSESYQHNFIDDETGDLLKPVSVREFQCWIDENVRFNKEKVDPMLFPETVEAIEAAKEKAEKIVSITEDNYVQTSARTDEKVIGPRSWIRADGKFDSETCEYSVTGVFVVGPGRGQSMKVCIAKEKCKVHWGDWQKAREVSAKASRPGASDKDKAKQEAEEKRRKEEQRLDDELRVRWKKAKPAIFKAISDRIKTMPTHAGSALASIILGSLRNDYGDSLGKKEAALPLGKTAEDFIRHAACLIMIDEASSEWRAHNEFPKMAKKIQLDIMRVVDEAAPVVPAIEKKELPKMKKQKAKKPGR